MSWCCSLCFVKCGIFTSFFQHGQKRWPLVQHARRNPFWLFKKIILKTGGKLARFMLYICCHSNTSDIIILVINVSWNWVDFRIHIWALSMSKSNNFLLLYFSWQTYDSNDVPFVILWSVFYIIQRTLYQYPVPEMSILGYACGDLSVKLRQYYVFPWLGI